MTNHGWLDAKIIVFKKQARGNWLSRFDKTFDGSVEDVFSSWVHSAMEYPDFIEDSRRGRNEFLTNITKDDRNYNGISNSVKGLLI